jgi:hypothetical protein
MKSGGLGKRDLIAVFNTTCSIWRMNVRPAIRVELRRSSGERTPRVEFHVGSGKNKVIYIEATQTEILRILAAQSALDQGWRLNDIIARLTRKFLGAF